MDTPKDNDKKRVVHNAGSFLGHVIEEKHRTAIELKMVEAAEQTDNDNLK